MGNEESTPQQPKDEGVTAAAEKGAPFVATSPTVLVTGGAGYIGSHTTLVLINNGYNVVAVDNFSNSFGSPDGSRSLALDRVEKITGKQIRFHKCDLLDKDSLDKVFSQYKIDAVIHFAAFKNVTESAKNPLLYHENNIIGMIYLLQTMQKHGVANLVFSGSCTVYGDSDKPATEDQIEGRYSVKNPYGKTKFHCEQMMKDVVAAFPGQFNMISLRYFNPIGAYSTGEIGEDPVKVNANIVPFLGEVAVGHAEKFTIFGDDYDTPDGTCIRDYIHVMDLAEGHVLALKKLEHEQLGFKAYNLGIGRGFSVKELINAFETASGLKINAVVTERRPFNIDAPKMEADPTKAKEELKFEPTCLSPVKMCKDFWTWKQKNPNGYRRVQLQAHVVGETVEREQ